MTALRQSWQVSLRYFRVLLRQPAFLLITIVQPLIWLLLFGALFKAVTQIPGFGGTGNYLDYLTPGIVVMLAVSSAGWTGMGFIEDINSGVMDRMLVTPAWRGAFNLGSVAQCVVSVVLQTLLIIGLALLMGAEVAHARRAAPRRGAAGRRVRVAEQRPRRAHAPARVADRCRVAAAAPADVPLERADAAQPRSRVDRDRGARSTRSTGPRSPRATRSRCGSGCSRRSPCSQPGSRPARSRSTSGRCDFLKNALLASLRDGHLLPPPQPRDGRLVLELRTPDLPGLHDADARRHALPRVLAAEDPGAQPALDGRWSRSRPTSCSRSTSRSSSGVRERAARARPGARRRRITRTARPVRRRPRVTTGGCISVRLPAHGAVHIGPEHARAVLARAHDRAGAGPCALRRRSTSCRCSRARSA